MIHPYTADEYLKLMDKFAAQEVAGALGFTITKFFTSPWPTISKALVHGTSESGPILFNPTNPAFMDAYLNVLHRSLLRRLLENGTCDFWWVDWQQGPISRIPGLDPLWELNHYQFQFFFQDHENQDGPGQATFFRGTLGRAVIAIRQAFPATAS
ncbi:hypothetical protein E4U36_008320 [Claviceps purpurea]|nr:hypothetical protein E4U36_008320 [Claviceps purpurea]